MERVSKAANLVTWSQRNFGANRHNRGVRGLTHQFCNLALAVTTKEQSETARWTRA